MRGECCDERETWGFEDLITLPSQQIFKTSCLCVSMTLNWRRRIYVILRSFLHGLRFRRLPPKKKNTPQKCVGNKQTCDVQWRRDQETCHGIINYCHVDGTRGFPAVRFREDLWFSFCTKMTCPVMISKVEVIKTWIENRITARLVPRPILRCRWKYCSIYSTNCLL